MARNRGKEPIIPNDIDTLADDELSLGSSPSLSPSPTKNARASIKAKSRKKPSHHPAFSDAISGISHRVRRKAGKRQNWPDQAPGNASIFPKSTIPPMPLVHPTFGIGPTFYMMLGALIRRPDHMLSSSLRQHILDYGPPHGFVIPGFATFDGFLDPYDHMLHYNQAMILNDGDDRLLCKVFLASLRGPTLAWFHKLPHNSINPFIELWAAFISQYLCSVRQKRNISSLQTILK